MRKNNLEGAKLQLKKVMAIRFELIFEHACKNNIALILQEEKVLTWPYYVEFDEITEEVNYYCEASPTGILTEYPAQEWYKRMKDAITRKSILIPCSLEEAKKIVEEFEMNKNTFFDS